MEQLKISVLEESELSLIAELQPPEWPSILPVIEFYTKSNYCFPMKVMQGDKIVGTGTAIHHHGTAWLAHIVTHSDHRNLGIGRLITQALVDDLTAKNFETIYLVATALGEPVYKKVGFETETEYVFFKGVRRNDAFELPSEILPFFEAVSAQIAALDRRVSGEERFFQLVPHLPAGCVYLENERVVGFYLPTYGDGLIIAEQPEAGLALMNFRLTMKDTAVFPVDNRIALEHIQQLGHQPIMHAKRMRLGKPRPWSPAEIYNRVGGNLG
jgi:Acetyltransferase (GNAT) domain